MLVGHIIVKRRHTRFLPRLKTRSKLDEQFEISDSIGATVVKTVVIPAKFTDPTLKVNYFVRRFKKIVKGEEIEWQNRDSKSHHLKFYDVTDDSIRLLFDLGKLEPNHSIKKKFAFTPGRIDYLCTIHNNEVYCTMRWMIFSKKDGPYQFNKRLRV